MELPSQEHLTPDDREAYLSEDLLSLVSASYAGDDEGWRRVPDSLTLDLGWYGPREEAGFYRLCVVRDSWDDVPLSLESPDQYVIRDAIDRILEDLAQGIPPEEIAASLKDG